MPISPKWRARFDAASTWLRLRDMPRWAVLASLIAGCVIGCSAHAAKIPVSFTAPTHGDDGTVLSELDAVIVEWGSCNGSAFGSRQSALTTQDVAIGRRDRVWIYPTGLTRVCILAFAQNRHGTSVASTVLVVELVSLDKPERLDQPIILESPNG